MMIMIMINFDVQITAANAHSRLHEYNYLELNIYYLTFSMRESLWK